MRMRPHVVLVSLVLLVSLVSLLGFCFCRGDWGLPFHHRRQPAPSLLLLQPASPPPSRPSPPPRTALAEASELLCRFLFLHGEKGCDLFAPPGPVLVCFCSSAFRLPSSNACQSRSFAASSHLPVYSPSTCRRRA